MSPPAYSCHFQKPMNTREERSACNFFLERRICAKMNKKMNSCLYTLSVNRTEPFSFKNSNRTGFSFRSLDLGSNGHWGPSDWSSSRLYLLYGVLSLFWSFDDDLVAVMNFTVIRSEPSDLSDGSDLSSLSLLFFYYFFTIYTTIFIISTFFSLKTFFL